MKVIKLMADYHGHPLWRTIPSDFGDISPEELYLKKKINTQQKIICGCYVFVFIVPLEQIRPNLSILV